MPLSDNKVMTYEPKICATLTCVWCHAPQIVYRIKCRVCGNCQYCGMLIDNAHGCRFCGNRTDERLAAGIGPTAMRRAERPRKAPDRPKRSVRRIGPQTRDRAANSGIQL